MELTLWQEILYGWIILTVTPKLLVIPIWRWMHAAMRATELQDAIDEEWLRNRGSSSGGGPSRRRRMPRPSDRDPRRRPPGGTAATIGPRPPRRVEATGRRMPRPVPAR
jgi:hypothetical protein